MKSRLLLILFLSLPLGALAESANSYQVTGPIVALTDNVITVQKGDERWEIARNASTKVDGRLAIGSRVTIHYKMAADRIEVKESATKASSTEKADRAAEKASQKAKK